MTAPTPTARDHFNNRRWSVPVEELERITQELDDEVPLVAVTEIERQRVHVHAIHSRPMPCPCCTNGVSANVARKAAEYLDVRPTPVRQRYACPFCGCELLYIMTLVVGHESWSLDLDTDIRSLIAQHFEARRERAGGAS